MGGAHYSAASIDGADESEKDDDTTSVYMGDFDDGEQYSEVSSSASENSWAAEDLSETGISRLPQAAVKKSHKKTLTAEEVCMCS